LLELHVVESKSFRTKVRYANGGWERLNFNHWEGIPSPVEQNDRHIAVLKDLLNDQRLCPARLGITMSPTLRNIVVVEPGCSILGDFKGDARIYRMDSLFKRVREKDPALLAVFKVISQETLYEFAARLATYHKPAPKTDLSRHVPQAVEPAAPVSLISAMNCQGCGGSVSTAEVAYSRVNRSRFGGLLLCRKCQCYVPKPAPTSAPELHETAPPYKAATAPCCAECRATLDQKVVRFCRLNSKRFAGRLLCRACQTSAVKVQAAAL
jgi:hypothetical protein